MVIHYPRDNLGRRNRLYPHSTGKRIRLTERDVRWMQAINIHGPLSTSELHALTGGNKQRVQNRLTDLFNEDNNAHNAPYLIRPHQQFHTIDSRYKELVYDLSKSGTKALQDNNRYHAYNATSPGPWWHGRAVAQFTVLKEIETLEQDNINYIPGWKILEKAGLTTTRYPTIFTDPYTRQRITKDLIPDALYGIEFEKEDGLYYRFHCVEVDRGTEPKTSPNMNRKSHERMKLQYQDYIENGKYREHLGISAPIVLIEHYMPHNL